MLELRPFGKPRNKIRVSGRHFLPGTDFVSKILFIRAGFDAKLRLNVSQVALNSLYSYRPS